MDADGNWTQVGGGAVYNKSGTGVPARQSVNPRMPLLSSNGACGPSGSQRVGHTRGGSPSPEHNLPRAVRTWCAFPRRRRARDNALLLRRQPLLFQQNLRAPGQIEINFFHGNSQCIEAGTFAPPNDAIQELDAHR